MTTRTMFLASVSEPTQVAGLPSHRSVQPTLELAKRVLDNEVGSDTLEWRHEFGGAVAYARRHGTRLRYEVEPVEVNLG